MASSSFSAPVGSVDARLSPDPVAQAALREKKPWQGAPNYFKKVDISAVAAMKMTQHAAVRPARRSSWRQLRWRGSVCCCCGCPRAAARATSVFFPLAHSLAVPAQAGVEKGLRSAHGMPVEIMGLLHGHPSTAPGDAGTIVVTDVSAGAPPRSLPLLSLRARRHLPRRRRSRPLPLRARRFRCPSRAPRRRSWRTTPR
jgi:hypothetical protein